MAVNRTASVSFVRSWREEITWIILPVCVVAATLLLLEHSVTCAYAAHHRFPFHFSLAPLPLCPAAVASGVQSFAFKQEAMSDEKQSEQSLHRHQTRGRTSGQAASLHQAQVMAEFRRLVRDEDRQRHSQTTVRARSRSAEAKLRAELQRIGIDPEIIVQEEVSGPAPAVAAPDSKMEAASSASGHQTPSGSSSSSSSSSSSALSSSRAAGAPRTDPQRGHQSTSARAVGRDDVSLFSPAPVRFTGVPLVDPSQPVATRPSSLPGATHDSMASLFGGVGYAAARSVPPLPPMSLTDEHDRRRSTTDDDDDEEDEDDRKSHRDRRRRITDRLAPTILRSTSATGALQWVRSHEWHSVRNRHEASQWALLIDAWRNDVRLPEDAMPLEIACRRLVGVVDADTSGSWDRAAAMELYRQDSLLTPEQLTFFSGVATKLNRATTSTTNKSDKKKGKRRGGGGGGAGDGDAARGGRNRRGGGGGGRGAGAAGAAHA